jgi:fibronectin type 3 domain-containing protein
MRDGDIKSRLNPLDPLIEKPVPETRINTSYIAVSDKWSNFSFRDSTGSLQCSLMQTYEYITLDYGENGDSLQQLSLQGLTTFVIDGFEINHPYIFKFTGYFRNGEVRTETFTDTTPSGAPPLPPSGIRGEGTLQGAMIQWDAVANTRGYTIQRSTAAGELLVLLRENTICTDPLPDYQAYSYKVGSANQYGAAYSDSLIELRKISVILPPGKCSASKGLYPDYVLLNWDRVENATSYRVYRSAAAEGMFTTIGVVPDTVFKDTISNNGVLYYRIASIDDSGYTGMQGTSVSGWITDSLDTPGEVSASMGVFKDRIMVFWGLVKRGYTYKIYKAPFSEGTYQLISTVPGSANYFTDSLITRIVNYYKVSVVDSNGIESRKSAFVSGTVKSIPVPDNVNATQGTSISEITVTWNPVTDAGSYFVYKSVNENGPYTLAGSSKTTEFQDAVGTDSSLYYRVSCQIAGIESEQSPAVHGWAMSDNAPSNLTASLGTFFTHISLLWQKSQGVQRYIVYRSATASGPYKQIATVDTSSYNDSTVLTDDYYYYRVAAVFKDSTAGKQSDYTMGFVETFNSPEGVNASDNHPSRIYVRWNSVPYSQYYIVYRSLTNGGAVPIDTVSGTTFIDTLLPMNTNGAYYQVCAGLRTRLGLRSATVKGTLLSPPSTGSLLSQDAGVFITWSSVSKAKQYKVYRSFSNQSNFTLIDYTPEPYTVDTAFTDVGTYYYRITSSNDSGESVTGLIVSVSYIPGPKTLSATVSNDTVKLWWPNISTSSYTVFRSQFADSGFQSIGRVYDTTYRDISALRSGDYYYQVRGNFSSTSYITTRSPVVKVSVLVKPQAPIVSASTSYSGYVRVSWSSNTSGSLADSFVVYRSTYSSGTYLPLDTVTGTYMYDSVPSLETYYYKVSGINKAGEGALSGYTYGYAISPSAPEALSATRDIYPKGILFTWKKSSSATSYIVSRASSSGGTRTVLDTVSDTVFFDTTVSAGVTRYYSVQSVTSRGLTSSYSTSLSGRRLGPPSSISVSGYTSYLLLSWTGSSVSDVYYKIYRATSSGGPFTVLDSTTASSYIDSVTSLVSYYYAISSVKNGESAQSSVYSGQLLPPPAPTMASASSGTSAVITVVWRKTSEAQSYKLYRSGTSSFTNSVLVGSPVDTFFSDTVPSDSFYYYKCKSVGLAGESSLSSGYVRGYRSPGLAPPIPQSLRVSSNNSSYIYLYWSMPSGIPAANKNNIYRSENQNGPFSVIDSVTNSSYYDYVPKTFPDKYWYYVTSKNIAGESAPSDTLSGSRQ